MGICVRGDENHGYRSGYGVIITCCPVKKTGREGGFDGATLDEAGTFRSLSQGGLDAKQTTSAEQVDRLATKLKVCAWAGRCLRVNPGLPLWIFGCTSVSGFEAPPRNSYCKKESG